jgi:MFS family permease
MRWLETQAGPDSRWGEILRGWLPLATGFIGVAAGFAALMSHSFGAFFLPVSESFGWSRAQYSLAQTIVAVIGAASSPLVGRIVDRYGPRAVAAAAILACAAGFGLISLMTGSLALFLGLVALTAIAGAGTSIITYVTLVNLWFDRARGLAIGIIMSGSGVCAMIAPKLIIPFIAAEGWRAGYRALALTMLLSLPLILLGARRPRSARRQPRDGAGHAEATAAELPGLTARQALSTGLFWRQAAAFALMGFGLGGLYAHLVPLLTDRGLAPADVANIAALFGFAVFAGRLIAGYLLDRIFAPFLAAVFVVLAVLGIGALAQPGQLFAAAAVLALGLAFATELDVAGYITARYFGRRAYGTIFGWLFGLFAVGGMTSPLMYGLIFDRTGSYGAALMTSVAVMLAAIPLLLSLGRYPEWPDPLAGRH